MAIAEDTDVRRSLLELLRERSYARRPVVLASGKTSDFFIDCKQSLLTAYGHLWVGEAMLDELMACAPGAQAVAGVELGGCPLASAVAQRSAWLGQPIDAVFVRKAAKGHGSARELEGDAHLAKGAIVVVLEDVVTTGGSTLRAVDRLRQHGYRVPAVIAVVDRQEGGAEAIRDGGLIFRSLFERRDFG